MLRFQISQVTCNTSSRSSSQRSRSQGISAHCSITSKYKVVPTQNMVNKTINMVQLKVKGQFQQCQITECCMYYCMWLWIAVSWAGVCCRL